MASFCWEFATLALAAAKRRLNWDVLSKSLFGSATISVMVLMIVSAAVAFTQLMACTGATEGTTMNDICKAATLYVICDLVAIIVVLAFPESVAHPVAVSFPERARGVNGSAFKGQVLLSNSWKLEPAEEKTLATNCCAGSGP